MTIKNRPYSGKLYRLKNKHYFIEEPENFYINYLEFARTYRKQDRFAGSRHNSGFYFANEPEVTICEMYFYQKLVHKPGETNVDALRKINEQTKKEYIILEIDVQR